MRERTAKNWSGYVTADIVKAAVESWAFQMNFKSLNEVGIVDGILDCVLFPLSISCPMFVGMGHVGNHWTDRCALAGVEVKVSKSDFMKGLKEGQFERYDKTLAGLYIAGPTDAFLKSDVPEKFGVLHVKHSIIKSDTVLVCRRHPTWKATSLTNDQMWRLLWAMNQQLGEEKTKHKKEYDDLKAKFSERAGRILTKAVASALTRSEY